jgi:hypothetical protein
LSSRARSIRGGSGIQIARSSSIIVVVVVVIPKGLFQVLR